MALRGIDVSQWQGDIDWNKVKQDKVDFAFLRAGFGRNNIDKTFHRNAKEANRVGIPIGLYWFSYALNTEMARQEARYCVEVARKYKVTWPIAFDLEYDTVEYAMKKGITITKTLATDMSIAFCEEVKRLGYIPMVYTNLDYLRRYFDRDKLPYDVWYAQYSKVQSVKDVAIWQYTSDGTVAGIAGRVDMNYGYKDYRAGSSVQKPQPAEKPLVFSETVKLGQAHARNFAVPDLVPDGYFGPRTQKACIQVLQHALNLDYNIGIVPDGIWGDKSEDALRNHGTKVSDKHYLITALEILLLLHGYETIVQNPGEFTDKLEEVVMKYQKEHGMYPDGVAGYKTFKSLIG